MKRVNFLMPIIFEKKNLYKAFWKARKGKDGKQYVQKYRKNLESNLELLSNQIQSTEVKVGDYNYFKIFDPKERLICAAAFEERVLHHALMNVCHSSFEQYQIYDSYASRKNKGQYAALERARYFQRKNKWFLKLDVRKYFDSINHEILMSLLNRRFKEKSLLDIFKKIIDSYHVTASRGLPIGNLTSQYFANHYLALSDHFIKEQLKVKAYVRYMDDMVLWHNDKDKLLAAGGRLSEFLSKKLDIAIKPFCLNKTHLGLPFLGYVVFKDKLHLNERSKKRFRNKLKQYGNYLATGRWTEQAYYDRITPLLAFTQKAASKKFREQCLKKRDKN